MNITKNIINDLVPLYLANECSADTRALIDDFFRQNPKEAAEIRRIMSAPVPGAVPAPARLDEMAALLKARGLVNRRSWLMAFAIFFSLTPFSFLHTGERTYWFFKEAPQAALVYGALGAILWIAYAVIRNRSQIL